MRTFIAIELPEDIINIIRTVQNQLKSQKLDIKWVKPENIHLTLRFLGEVSPENINGICAAMDHAVLEASSFSLIPKGLGAFPGFNRPRVLWMGINRHTEQLNTLYQGLEDQLESAGFEKEKRSYKGHLTLGRVTGKIDPVHMIDITGQYKNFTADAFKVNEIILFKSILDPTGAVYKKLYKVKLTQ